MLVSAATCSVAFAAVPPVAPNPVVDTTPYGGDAKTVVAFFKFNCPVCRNYHMALDYWGRSLPKQMNFQFYPVIEGDNRQAISDDSVKSSMMFWAIDQAGTRSQRAAFADSAYAINQDSHSQSSMKAWIGAAAASGVTLQQFKLAWAIETKTWAGRAARQTHYKPTATPTLVICGKWMITPDSTNGNQEMFMQLANGLVSKCMVEQGIPH
jgi:thiol:disulfide interchange protein DsbA